MTTVFFTNSNKMLRPTEHELTLVLSDDGGELDVYRGTKLLGTVELGTTRLFRPDQDAMYISESGRIWRPMP